jgi:hypothetical protein
VNRIFLGRWWHWAILVASVGALWIAGDGRMHVIHFNAFILSLLLATTIVLAILLARTRPGERITRDPLYSPAAHSGEEEAQSDPPTTSAQS